MSALQITNGKIAEFYFENKISKCYFDNKLKQGVKMASKIGSGVPFGALYTDGDNRHNLNEPAVLASIKEQAGAVACLITSKNLLKRQDGQFICDQRTTLESQGWQAATAFKKEPLVGFGTAFLVSSKLVLTAGHCADESTIGETRLVFNLTLQRAKSPIPGEQIYRIKGIIAKSLNNLGDYALLEIDREVVGVKPLTLDLSSTPKDVYMLGHPYGLPLKYTKNGAIKSLTAKQFEAALDAFEGNSGSPVFDQITKKVVGILVAGNPDYEASSTGTRDRHYTDSKSGYEKIQRISALPQTCLDRISGKKAAAAPVQRHIPKEAFITHQAKPKHQLLIEEPEDESESISDPGCCG